MAVGRPLSNLRGDGVVQIGSSENGCRIRRKQAIGKARTIGSGNAAHRALQYPTGRLLSGSLIAVSTRPHASARTIAPGTPGLKLRDAPIVTFHVAVRTFCQTRCKPAPFPFRECRFLSIRVRHPCCGRNPKHQQNHRHSFKVQHNGPFVAAFRIEPTAGVHQIWKRFFYGD